jgi:hypothetical protein
LKQDPDWAKILTMDKNEVLLFIAERLETITMMGQGRYSGKIQEKSRSFTKMLGVTWTEG